MIYHSCINTSGITRVQFSRGGGTRGCTTFSRGTCHYLNILYLAASNEDLFFQKPEWGSTNFGRGGGTFPCDPLSYATDQHLSKLVHTSHDDANANAFCTNIHYKCAHWGFTIKYKHLNPLHTTNNKNFFLVEHHLNTLRKVKQGVPKHRKGYDI